MDSVDLISNINIQILLGRRGFNPGMAAFMLLLQFVRDENSYDELHQNSDNMYRVRFNGYRI